jgi:5-methylthioadenosine/S-adenosylhomocysteine deaminase
MLFKDITIVDENFNVDEHMNVIVVGDRIMYVGKTAPEQKHGITIEGRNRILIPGFFNAHAHSPMSLMRGYGENMSLQDWLGKRIFPFESKLNSEAVYMGTLLAMAESFKYGIVSTSDMYYFCEDMARAVEECGAKANISRSVTNIEGITFDKLDSVREATDFYKAYNGAADGRILVDMSLHAEYTSDEETARGLAEVSKELGAGMHVHVSETMTEHEECKKRHGGKSPVEYLAGCGIFDQPAIAAHCVWIEGKDYEILKNKGVTIATNPVSNMKLASGMADVWTMMDKGISVAIGTDSVASNNNLNMFEEMKTMVLASKIKREDPVAVTPVQAFEAATVKGALAQQREDTGLIKQGYKADLVMLRTDSPNMTPVHDMMTNLVFSADPSDILMTVIDGRVVYDHGEFPTLDMERISFGVNKEKNRILDELRG